MYSITISKESMSKYSFSLNTDLYLRDPLSSDTGKRILEKAAPLLVEMGLEAFTAKKLAEAAGLTEATVYKYFANKQKLLQYYFQLYWTWLEQQIKVFTAVEDDPKIRLLRTAKILSDMPEVAADPGMVSKETLRMLVVNEGVKAFHHAHVDADNEKKLFAPYKSITKLIANMILEVDPKEPFPFSMATTFIEMAHSLEFYKDHMPALTDFSQTDKQTNLTDFLVHFINIFIEKSKN